MIVKANKDHLEKILDIELDSFDNPWSYQSFLNEINNDVGSNWVYLQHANLLGYMFGWIIQGDYHINNIAVKVSARRKGLAKKMIDNIIFSPRIKNAYLDSDFARKPFRNLRSPSINIKFQLKKKYF